MAAESCMSIHKGHTFRSFKYLDDRLIFINFHDTAQLPGAVVDTEFDDLIIGGVPYSFQNNKRAVDLA